MTVSIPPLIVESSRDGHQTMRLIAFEGGKILCHGWSASLFPEKVAPFDQCRSPGANRHCFSLSSRSPSYKVIELCALSERRSSALSLSLLACCQGTRCREPAEIQYLSSMYSLSDGAAFSGNRLVGNSEPRNRARFILAYLQSSS